MPFSDPVKRSEYRRNLYLRKKRGEVIAPLRRTGAGRVTTSFSLPPSVLQRLDAARRVESGRGMSGAESRSAFIARIVTAYLDDRRL